MLSSPDEPDAVREAVARWPAVELSSVATVPATVAVLTQSDPTGFSSPLGQVVVLLALLTSLVVLLRWWWQQRKR